MLRTARCIATLAVALAVAAPAPGYAQIGGLVKKAKSAVQRQRDAPSGPQLTAQAVEGVLKGLEAQMPILDQRDAVSKQRDAALQDRSKLFDAHPDGSEAYSEAESKNEVCMDSVFTQINDARGAKLAAMGQQLAGDPAKLAAFEKDIMAMQQKAMQMMQQGDTAGATRVQLEYRYRLTGADPKADTTEAVKACGAPPVKPTWLVTADADAARADTLNGRMRDLEERASSTAVTASGLSAEEFAQVRERIITWYEQQDSRYPNQGFTDAEVKLLRARQAEIAKLERIF
jgi:hypothetical protein